MSKETTWLNGLLLSYTALVAVFSIAVIGTAASSDAAYNIADTKLTERRARVAGVSTAANVADWRGKVITTGNGLYYYFGFDNKRYVLPRPGMPDAPSTPTYDVLLSWFGTTDGVLNVALADLQTTPLGGNATMRPGHKLLRVESDTKIYAVVRTGVLRHITSDSLLVQLYGSDWANRVAVVPDAFFINYIIAEPITTATHPDGTLLKYQGSNDIYLIANGKKRKFADGAFTANRYQSSALVEATSTIAHETGQEIGGAEDALVTVAGPVGTAITQNVSEISVQEKKHDKQEEQQSEAKKEVRAEVQELRSQVKELETENKYLKTLFAGSTLSSAETANTLRDFITYGVDDNTKKLGAGERAAVLYSYKIAYGRLPEKESEIADAIKIANGRWPTERSETAEARATAIFERIYRRQPDMTNPKDNAAVTIMAYGLRQRAVNRNLTSERAGIVIFRNIFGRTPSTTEEWNTMQAITYSGAKR